MGKPLIINGRLDVSHLDAAIYILRKHGPLREYEVHWHFEREFPGADKPRNFASLLSNGVARGRLARAGRGVYAAVDAGVQTAKREPLPFNAVAAVTAIVYEHSPVDLATIHQHWFARHPDYVNYNLRVALARAKKRGDVISGGRGVYCVPNWA